MKLVGKLALAVVAAFALLLIGVATGVVGGPITPAPTFAAAEAVTPESYPAPSRVGALILGDGATWAAASPEERGEAVAIMATAWGDERGWTISERRASGAYLLGCLNGAFDGSGAMNDLDVADIAAMCEAARESGN